MPAAAKGIGCGMQVRARLLADAEEREAQRLASDAMEAMLKRLERKLQQFTALEEALVKEKTLAEVSSSACSVHTMFQGRLHFVVGDAWQASLFNAMHSLHSFIAMHVQMIS